ncbi:hypothetical protein ACLKMH_24330 [Psychromonas sp. KJ10-10]|uniref:hypothetical protein n=1 Tax=Psychromonas sp. KJ10-10 TaxID=3391823 RepID=UPI0039B36824
MHSKAGLESAKRITQWLFNGHVQQLTLSELTQLELDGLDVTRADQGVDLCELLVLCDLAKSKRIARELINNNAIKVNSELIEDESMTLDFPLFDQFWIIQRGKKQFKLIKKIKP